MAPTPGSPPQPDLAPLWRVLGRVRRRLRLQAAGTGAVQGGIAGAALLLCALLAFRLGALSRHGLRAAALAAAGLLLFCALLAALRRIRLLDVAGRVDRSHDLHDRMGSALQFHAGQRDATDDDISFALRDLTLRDAVHHVPTVVPARAAPWHRPRGVPVLAGLLLACAAAALLRLPRRQQPAPDAPRAAALAPRLLVEPELLAPERQEVARLLAEALREGDEDLAAIAREMERLLDQVERGELTRKEAFDRLAELEQRLMQGRDGTLEELRQRLRKAGAELGKDKLARELGQALQKEDLDKAQRELMRLSKLAQERAAKERDAQKQDKADLARSLRRAAEAQQKDEWKDKSDAERRTREEQQLREEERRLKKKLEQEPNDEESARRLKKVQRDLERLRREQEQRDQARRELERLQRDMQKAAEELERQLDKMTPEQRKALEQLAKDMNRMQDEIRKLQRQNGGQGAGGQAMVTLGSIKQVLRRVGRSGQGQGQGQGQQGQGQGQAQNGQGQGKGQGKGQGQGQGQGQGKNPMKDFLDRAGGKGQGGDSDVLVEGEGGKGDQQIMILGEGNTPVVLPGLGQQGQQGQGQQGQGQQGPPGDGIGKDHDPNLLGDPTRMEGKRRLTRVQGKEGAGPSRSETILGAAERGFSNTAYRKVYGDYAAAAEEAMSAERVPPGYRFYIKRYQQLIHPRE